MQSDPEPARPADLKRLGRYKIVRPLSKGGMALVYEARRESLAGVSPRVAIKLILPEHEGSDTFRDLFINEARLGASMHHQNLVQIQDFDCDEDRYFLVMEYVEGLTLRRLISTCRRAEIHMPIGVISEIGRQACDGLHYAHCAQDERGRHLRLVHRDMKPSNLILNPHGVIKVLDFGISKGRLRRERQGSVKGTWGYMAPEQALGRPVWPTADVFGLAVVLVELASLRPMFLDKGKDEIKRLLADDHAARMAATLDPAFSPLVPVLVRALQRDPKARFQSAEEFGRALSSLLPDPITARDEVTRFYELIEALDAGGSVPATGRPASQGDQASLVLAPAASEARPARSGTGARVLATALVSALAMVVALAVILLGYVIGTARTGSADEVAAEALAAPSLQEVVGDEPPGPAGVGAPGEAEPMAHERPAPAMPRRHPRPPEAAARPDEPVVIRVERPAPKTIRVKAPPSEEVQAPAPPEVLEPGVLIVGARQAAEVYIQGQFVAMSPVQRELPPGRYTVSIVAPDGRRASAEVHLQPGQQVEKTWDFERNSWR